MTLKFQWILSLWCTFEQFYEKGFYLQQITFRIVVYKKKVSRNRMSKSNLAKSYFKVYTTQSLENYTGFGRFNYLKVS